MAIRKVLGILAICTLFVAAGCSGGDSDDSSSSKDGQSPESTVAVSDSDWDDQTGQATVTIDARDNSFSAKYVSVSPGTKIIFHNRGRNPHNAIALDKAAFETVTVDEFKPGDSDERSFDDVGEFRYYCSLHGTPTAGMIGGIRVVGD